jgi:hypothetical protein
VDEPDPDELEPDADGESGPITISLPFREAEVRLLGMLCSELRASLAEDSSDPSLARLRASAYANDPEQEAAWQLIARSDLDDARLEAIGIVLRTLAAGEATAAELHAWLKTVNALRLVLGTQLDIREDEHEPDFEGPDAERWAIYEWLGATLDWLLHRLTEGDPSAQ